MICWFVKVPIYKWRDGLWRFERPPYRPLDVGVTTAVYCSYSPDVVRMKTNGQKFGGKDVLEPDPSSEVLDFQQFIGQHPERKYAGFGIRINSSQCVLRTKGME